MSKTLLAGVFRGAEDAVVNVQIAAHWTRNRT